MQHKDSFLSFLFCIGAILGLVALDWGSILNTPTPVSALASVTPNTDKLFYFTGPTTAAVTSITSVARTLLDDPSYAAIRQTLGIATSDYVQFAGVYIGNAGTGPRVLSDSGTDITLYGNGTTARASRHTLAGITVPSAAALSWSVDTDTRSATDLSLLKNAANTLGLQNGTYAQRFNIGNTYASSSSYEYLSLQAAGTELRIGSAIGSVTGVNRPIKLGHFDSAGSFTSSLTIETGGGVTLAGVGDLTTILPGLTAIAALTPTDGNIIVGNGTTWVAESGATARTSLGLGTGDSPTFGGLSVTAAAGATGNLFSVTRAGDTTAFVEFSQFGAALGARRINARGEGLSCFTDADTHKVSISQYGVRLTSDLLLSWASVTSNPSTIDLTVARDGADKLAIKRSTNPQEFRVYGNDSGASYIRGSLACSTSAVTLSAQVGGSYTNADLVLTPAGTGSVIVPLGTSANPGIDFGNTGIGFTRPYGGDVYLSGGGTEYIGFSSTGIDMIVRSISRIASLKFNSVGVNTTILLADADNTLAQRNSTNAQTFRIYATNLASNESYLQISTSTTAQTIAAIGAGTNANADIVLTPAGTGYTRVSASGLATTSSASSSLIVLNNYAVLGYAGSATSRAFVTEQGHANNPLGKAFGTSYLTMTNCVTFGQGGSDAVVSVSNGTYLKECFRVHRGGGVSIPIAPSGGAHEFIGANYERLRLYTVTGQCTILAESAGTGSSNIDIVLTPAGTGKVKAGQVTLLSDASRKCHLGYNPLGNDVAVGFSCSAYGYNSVAIGYSAYTNNSNSVAVGVSAQCKNGVAASDYAVAIGYDVLADTDNVTLLGQRLRGRVAKVCEIGYWSATTTRVSSLRLQYQSASFTLPNTATALTDGGATPGSEADGTLGREMYAVRRNGDAILIDINVGGTIKTLSLGTAT